MLVFPAPYQTRGSLRGSNVFIGSRLAYLVGSFEENGVDGELLLDLSSEDACAELGVKHIHRKMLLREVDKLREPNDFTQ